MNEANLNAVTVFRTDSTHQLLVHVTVKKLSKALKIQPMGRGQNSNIRWKVKWERWEHRNLHRLQGRQHALQDAQEFVNRKKRRSILVNVG